MKIRPRVSLTLCNRGITNFIRESIKFRAHGIAVFHDRPFKRFIKEDSPSSRNIVKSAVKGRLNARVKQGIGGYSNGFCARRYELPPEYCTGKFTIAK